MLTQERQNRIVELLIQRKALTVTELTELLDTSESTIRRDLVALDKLGRIHKVHGGATINNENFFTFEEDVITKSSQNINEKIAIGKYAASLIKDEDFVYIDAGTTTEKLIDFITCNKATFVTNGIVHAKKLIQKGLKAYVVGGELKLATEAIVGADGISNMQKFNFTKAFIGSNGISVEAGFTTPDLEEALMKKEAISRSYMAYILADHSKIGKIMSVSFGSIDQGCIITDYLGDDKIKNATIVKEVLIDDLHSNI